MVKIISKYRFNYSLLFCFIFSTLTFIFFPGYNSFASTQVVLEWTSNNEPDLAGYRVFAVRKVNLMIIQTHPGKEQTIIVQFMIWMKPRRIVLWRELTIPRDLKAGTPTRYAIRLQ